ncbi:hypothetical protein CAUPRSCDRAFT_10728 [Caulochytrium protostelioides]|uniref:Uncharacterized protein n=1 Tax=Caulochytrium protostelioides TaxID=1555241 RepID=A0A4P9WWA8_9FUNG|nr:hypothetical protein CAUPRSCDRAFT_10728 [Caulochytrium protostelioides]
MSLHETSSTEAGPRATDLTNKTLNRGRRDEGANLIFQNASPDGSEDYSSHAASGVPAGTAMLDVNQAEKMTRRAQPSAAQQAAVPTSSLPATSVAQDIPTGHHPTGAMLDYNLAEKKAHQSHHPSTSSSSLPAQSSSKLNDAKLNQLEQDEAEYRDRNASALKAHARHEAETFRQGVTHGSLNPKHETQKEIDALEKSEAAYRQSMQPHIQHNANLEAAAIEQKFKNDANTSSLPSMPAIPSMADVTESAKAIGANTVGALGAGMTTVANAVTPSPQTTQSIKNALPTTETAINLKNAVTPSQQTTENIKAAVVPSQETTDSIKNAVLPSKATTDSLSAAAEVPVHGITNLATRAKETVGDVSNYATAAATNAAVTASSLWDAVFQTNNDRFRVDALEGCEQQYRQTPGVVSHQKAHARREALIVKKAVNQKDGLEVPDLDAHVVTPSHVVSDLPKEDNSEWKEIDRQEDKAREERKQLAIDQMALAKDTSNIIKEKNKPAPGLLSGTANAAANAASAALAGVFGINMSSPNEQHKSRDIPHSDNVSKAHGAPSNERGHIEHKTPSPSTTAESLTARSPEKADEEPRQHHWHDHQRRGPVVDIHGPKDVSGPAPSRIVAHHGSGPSPSDLAMGQNESSAPISENRQHMPYAAGSVEPFMENQPTHPETDRDGGQGDWIHPDSHQHQHQLPRSAATQEQRPLGSERHHAPHAKIEPIPVAPQHHHDEQQSQHRPLQSQLHQMPEVNRTLPSEHHHVHSDRQHAPEPAIPRSHIPHSNVSSASGVTDVLPAGQISGSQPGNTAYSEVPGTTSVHMADPTHLPSNLVDQPIEHISATRVTRRPINDVAETMRAILPTDGAVPVKTSALQNIKVEGAPPAFENPTGGEKLMNFVVNGPEGFSEGGVRPFRPSDQKVAGDHHHHNHTSQPQATVPIASAAEVPGMTQHTRSDLSTNPASSHHGSTSAPTSRNVQQEVASLVVPIISCF